MSDTDAINLDVMPNMACITDVHAGIQRMNVLFSEYFQPSAGPLVGQTLVALLSPRDRILSCLNATGNKKAVEAGIQLYMQPDKQCKFLAHIKPLQLRTGPVFLWSLVDISRLQKNVLQKEKQIRELDDVNNRLVLERDYLRETALPIRDIDQMVGQSLVFRQMIERIESVAATEASVLISGESGSGKELVARMIHEKSVRREEPLVTVNCASIPRELFESEFFGHIKGAFSGAVQDRIGRFEMANHGTLFLDEVGEIPYELQSKLLRSIQQKSFERVGENVTHEVDIRIIAATNRDLEKEVEQGTFREDLYYRLSVFPVSVPPLRKRKDDVVALAEYFLDEASREFRKEVVGFTAEQKTMLTEYSWPGNIRELKNVIERAVILCDRQLRLDLAMPELALKQINSDMTTFSGSEARGILTDKQIKQLEFYNLIHALEKTSWRVSGTRGAAALLDVNASTLNSKMRALKIKKPATTSLYSHLGGIQGISAVIDDLLPRLRSDEQLGRFWQDRGADSIRREKQLLVEYICMLTGGPFSYSGRSMLQVHQGMNITPDDWDHFLTILTSLLSAHGVTPEDQKTFLIMIKKLAGDIVETAD